MTDKILTENCAVTFGTADDSRVDFFFHITEDAQKDKTIDLLTKSWTTDALDTLKLVAFLRDCRNGKGIRRQYHMCLIWLFDNHFETLIHNLQHLVAFGYWKDLLHILIVLLFDGLIPDYMAADDGIKSSSGGTKKTRRHLAPSRSAHQAIRALPTYDVLVLKADKVETKKRVRELNARQKASKAKGKASNETTDVEMTDQSIDETAGIENTVLTREESLQSCRSNYNYKRYNSDEKYRRLYDKVVELFSHQLKNDLEKMEAKNPSVSLAAKWAPTNAHHFDKYLGISSAIAKELCQLLEKTELIKGKQALADFYQRQVCSPLRAYLKIPEVYMSANEWSLLDYNRVASKCMQKNKKLFMKHDKERFEQFVASKKTISGAVLKPVEMVERGDKLFFPGQDVENIELEKEILNKQWMSLVEDLKKKGGCLLNNSIAVCDVSGSMNGTPMSAARGLTILIMSLSEKPWNSLCITFSESPQFHHVEPDLTFVEKLQSIQENSMDWGGNTNLDKVFDQILNKAVEQRLTNDQMPKMLFIFSDMEFDQACPNTTMTNYESAKQKFEFHNYKLPSVVFWNLRGNTSKNSTPVQIDQNGTALMSGYSGQQLTLIMKVKELDKLNPYFLMRSAIDNKRYANLKVVD